MMWNYWIWEAGCWRVLATYTDRDVHYFRTFLDHDDRSCLCLVNSERDQYLRRNCWDPYANRNSDADGTAQAIA